MSGPFHCPRLYMRIVDLSFPKVADWRTGAQSGSAPFNSRSDALWYENSQSVTFVRVAIGAPLDDSATHFDGLAEGRSQPLADCEWRTVTKSGACPGLVQSTRRDLQFQPKNSLVLECGKHPSLHDFQLLHYIYNGKNLDCHTWSYKKPSVNHGNISCLNRGTSLHRKFLKTTNESENFVNERKILPTLGANVETPCTNWNLHFFRLNLGKPLQSCVCQDLEYTLATNFYSEYIWKKHVDFNWWTDYQRLS